MCTELTDSVVATIKDAAEKLTGQRKRIFQAKLTWDYLGGSARRAETVFGWGREAVQKGWGELQRLRQKPRAIARNSSSGWLSSPTRTT